MKGGGGGSKTEKVGGRVSHDNLRAQTCVSPQTLTTTHSPRPTLDPPRHLPARTLLGGGHKNQVDSHTGRNVQSKGGEDQDGEGGPP